MSMSPFSHADAATVAEAVSALDADTRPVAGGTDLLELIKAGLAAPQRLVNHMTIPGLGAITETHTGWRIGALINLAQLAEALARVDAPGLAGLRESLMRTASPQLRHMATLGGNLVQKPRCWYYRNAETPCWRKGGRLCYAFRGENAHHALWGGGPCYAVHPSDPAVALLALETRVTIAGRAGERTVPFAALYRQPDRENRENHVLAPDELVTAVDILRPAPGARSAYVKVAERATWDFALASAAVQLVMARGVVRQARIALGGVGVAPWRAQAAEEALVGHRLSEATRAAAAVAATQGARPLEHNAYKVELVQGVVAQALRVLA